MILKIIFSLYICTKFIFAAEQDDYHMFKRTTSLNYTVHTLKIKGRSDLTSLAPLRYFPNLTHLHIEACFNIRNLSQGIGYVSPSITKLSLVGLGLINAKAIAALSSLQSLNLESNLSLTSISGLERLPELKQLNLTNCSSIKNFPILGELKKLEKLSLASISSNGHGRPFPSSTHFFSELGESLEYLDINACTAIRDLSVIRELKRLKYLGVSGNDYLCASNFSHIQSLGELEYLSLGQLFPISFYYFLKNMPKLKEVKCFSQHGTLESFLPSHTKVVDKLNIRHPQW